MTKGEDVPFLPTPLPYWFFPPLFPHLVCSLFWSIFEGTGLRGVMCSPPLLFRRVGQREKVEIEKFPVSGEHY